MQVTKGSLAYWRVPWSGSLMCSVVQWDSNLVEKFWFKENNLNRLECTALRLLNSHESSASDLYFTCW